MPNSNRKDEVLAKLLDGITNLANSDKWQDWLKIQSRFHRYSFGNTLLIQLQCPAASRVAGFHAWRRLGRNVRKGEKAIWILAPVTHKVDSEDEETRGKRAIVAFKPAAVFDIGQTDGEELPEVCNRLEGDDGTGLFEQLLPVAAHIGYTVEDAEFHDSRNGDCTFDLHRIRVASDRSPVQRAKTLAHELGHALLHERFDNRAVTELEAESVAYIVCDAYGINSSEYSFGYVAGWAGGGDEAIAAIKASAQRIQKAADTILTRLESGEEQDSEAA